MHDKDEATQPALFDIEGPDEDGCVWICSAQGRDMWCHNLGPADRVTEKLSQWLAQQDDGESFLTHSQSHFDRIDEVIAQAAAVAALLGAYFATPLLAYADAESMYLVGALFAIGAGGMWLSARLVWSMWLAVGFAVVSFVGLVIGFFVLNQATLDYRANEVRCAAVQKDMLSAKPVRADAPELFQALKCTARLKV